MGFLLPLDVDIRERKPAWFVWVILMCAWAIACVFTILNVSLFPRPGNVSGFRNVFRSKFDLQELFEKQLIKIHKHKGPFGPFSSDRCTV